MSIPHLVVVMPAFNEAEGIAGFIDEIRDCVTPLVERVTFVVADDQSTDGTAAALADITDVQVERQAVNRGHGPTALAAYRAGLALSPDVRVHVDGDGQFLGTDFPVLLRALASSDADVVHGVRGGRTDPWYRKVLTGCVRLLVALASGRGVPDVNTPLRAYRPEVAQALVSAVPDESLVPHVHFSLAEVHSGFTVRYVRVRSIPRRGASTTGTMWGRGPRIALPPARLRTFAVEALGEVWRTSLSPTAPLRGIHLIPDAPAGAAKP